MKSKVQELAQQVDRFTFALTEYGYRDEEFHCLYLLVDSLKLDSLYETVAKMFPQIQGEHFQQMPHLSVLYGAFSANDKRQMIATNTQAALDFNVDSLDLYLTNNPIGSWQLIESFTLG